MALSTTSQDLSRERTALASERTFLAYVRTAVSIAALGILILHFLADASSRLFAFVALSLAALIFAYALWRLRDEQHRLRP